MEDLKVPEATETRGRGCPRKKVILQPDVGGLEAPVATETCNHPSKAPLQLDAEEFETPPAVVTHIGGHK